MSKVPNVANWVGQTTTTVGSGNIGLSGNIAGYAPWSSIPDGAVWYAIIDGDNREAGVGTLSGSTLERTTIYSTLVGGVFSDSLPTPISLSGNASVYCTFNKTAFDDFNVGQALQDFVAGENISAGQVCILSSDQMVIASNSSEALSTGFLAVAQDNLLSGETGAFILRGYVTIGGVSTHGPYYLGASGVVTNATPSGNSEFVRIVGHYINSNTLYFRPDETWLELNSSGTLSKINGVDVPIGTIQIDVRVTQNGDTRVTQNSDRRIVNG